MDERFLIREATTADLAPIVTIEAAVFPDPWTIEAFRVFQRAGQILVAVHEDEVVGFVIARAMLDEGEILNIAVTDGWRGQGAGAILLNAALDRLRGLKAKTVYLEVRASSTHAQHFYERHRFRRVGKRPRYYRNPVEDALVFFRGIDATSESA